MQTNRELLQSLDNETFALAIKSLVFRPSLWVKGSDVKRHSTPSDEDIQHWLDGRPVDNVEFWSYLEVDFCKEIKPCPKCLNRDEVLNACSCKYNGDCMADSCEGCNHFMASYMDLADLELVKPELDVVTPSSES